ncbi:hypothetical protein [Streptomyces sp. KLOTTS4A1]|uniref:hypothetical protein n=1 Tax=Streptomyces sp. KLOTTS4A1 TaxID=3390996 RepID=UPI0039F52796
MGWTVLYIAFGLVALWLLGEVLLQYKARLRWRLLAFGGFLGVVLGVLIPSVYVIGAGAMAFAVGQTYVTLSFRRGFSTGWAIGGSPGESRRRKGVPGDDPTLEVSELEYEAEYGDEDAGEREGHEPAAAPHGDSAPGYDDTAPGYDDRAARYDDRDSGYDEPESVFGGPGAYGSDDGYPQEQPSYAQQQPSLYATEPMPDDTGSYGIYDDAAAQGYPQQPAAASADASGYGYGGYDDAYTQQAYGYDQQGQQSYAAYSDPYIGSQPYDTGQYETYGGQQSQQGYDSGQYPQYQQGAYGDGTPPDGVWVPQQRNGDETFAGGLPPEQPGYQPYQQDAYDTGYNEQQYRY